MKIGIITFHRACNYGAVLQCYALQRYLKTEGHEVEVIDYHPQYFKTDFMNFNLGEGNVMHKFIRGVKLIALYLTKRKKQKAFKAFVDMMPLSKPKHNIMDFQDLKYDAIVFGSDQIWNPLLTGGIDKVFIGEFPKNNSKFISYAASTDLNICDKEHSKWFQNIVMRFDEVSTRETSFSEYLNSIVPMSSSSVLDPVFLLNKKEWGEISIPTRKNNYLLIYTVPQSPHVRHLASMIAKDRGLEIVEIRPQVELKFCSNLEMALSPQEFIGLFMNASYVVTTSFHGTALSIVFKKQFSTLAFGTSVDNRASDLLYRLCLSERLVSINHLSLPREDIDYEKKNDVISRNIQLSKRFLTVL